MSDFAPEFPLASDAVAPLRKKSEANGSTDYTQLWSGQAASLGKSLPARKLTQLLAEETTRLL
jgi:nitronate monooxygenase